MLTPLSESEKPSAVPVALFPDRGRRYFNDVDLACPTVWPDLFESRSLLTED